MDNVLFLKLGLWNILINVLMIRLASFIEQLQNIGPWHMGDEFHNLIPFLKVPKACNERVTCHSMALTRSQINRLFSAYL